MEKWKTQKARFPLSHRACHKKQRDDQEKKRTEKEGGFAAAITPPTDLTVRRHTRPCPQV